MRKGRLLVSFFVALGLVSLLLAALEGRRTQAMVADDARCWARIPDDDRDFLSVQAALDAVSSGGVVKVAGHCAEMTRTIHISKSLRIRGGYTVTNWITPDATVHATVLDGQSQRRVLFIEGPFLGVGEPITVTLEGLIITGGDAGMGIGGGVYATNARTRISRSRVAHNVARWGGGLYASRSHVDLQDTVVAANEATEYGGGLYLDRGSAVIARSTITRNRASMRGGGLYLSDSDPVSVTDSAVISNVSENDSGGVHLDTSSLVLEDTLVSGNCADDDAGGVYLYRPLLATASRSVFVGNVAEDKGGAIYVREGGLSLVNDVIGTNRASYGGGIYLEDASSDLLHATVASNRGESGVSLVGQSDMALTNTILVSHTTALAVSDTSSVTLVATLWGSGVWANESDWEAEGSLTTASDYWEPPGFTASDVEDFRIGPGSGAVDSGLPTSVSTDIEGDPRPIGPAPDLGADEVWKVVYLPLATRSTGAAKLRP